jgi:hypothetical protein
MFVRVLRHWRGLPAGVFADVRGKHLREGVAEAALDDKADIKDVPGAVKHPEVIGEDEPVKTSAKGK